MRTASRTLGFLGLLTAVFIGGYWALVFTGLFVVEEMVAGYRAWFMAFPLADAWIAVWGVMAYRASSRRDDDRLASYAMLMGSGLVFLGLYALSYGAITGLLWQASTEEAVELAIKAYCLLVGGAAVVHGLRRAHRSRGSHEIRA